MKRIIISLLTAGMLLGGCTKDFEKINTSPNDPEEFLTGPLFANASYGFLFNLHLQRNSATTSRTWMQYSAQTTYTKDSRFINTPSIGEGIWQQSYKRAHNLKKIIDLNRDPKTGYVIEEEGGSNIAQIAAARTYMVYIFSILVDTFGDVPYYSDIQRNNPKFQALQTDKYITPVYASQKDIYLDLLQTLKQVSNDLNEATEANILTDYSGVFPEGDFLFKSIGTLKHFTNSLRLRIANHLRYIDGTYVNDAELEAAAKEVIDYYAAGHDDELLQPWETIAFPYEASYHYLGPIHQDYFVDDRLDYAPSNSFVDLLAGRNQKANATHVTVGVDPRIEKYFTPIEKKHSRPRDEKPSKLDKWAALYGDYQEAPSTEAINTARYKGMPYGMAEGTTEKQFGSGSNISLFAPSILIKDTKQPVMEYAEVCFILSEIRGWNQAKYEEGVRASMEKWKVSDARIADYMATLPAASEATVLTQKYIALYLDPNEAWAEYRRTGYPKTLIQVGDVVNLNIPEEDENGTTRTTYTFTSLEADINEIPDRIGYPLTYTGLNVANYQQAVRNMGMNSDSRTHRLIFAQKRPALPRR